MANEKQAVDPALVRELASILKEAGLGEIEVEQGDLKIRVSKPAAPVAAAPISYAVPEAAPAPVAAAAPAASPAPVVADGDVIKSPMVGSFYGAPSPDSDAFVKVGDSITESSVVCILEAMKVMNEIKAEISGTITEILVNDGEAVEFGQPLFRIKRS